MIFHHEAIKRRARQRYSEDDLRNLRAFLCASGTLVFEPLASGLYPAAPLHGPAAAMSGYGNVWVRDNVYVAWAHELNGDLASACVVANALGAFYSRYRSRLVDVVEARVDAALRANRPHVRFDGATLSEIPARWAHAQNDALGYFVWLYCRLARRRALEPDQELLALFALYFERIAYWHDEDSGHWEETRKIGASSIGAVIAGLHELRAWLAEGARAPCRFGATVVTADFADDLIERGRRALADILPAECVQDDPRKARRYDAALLFLVWPLDVVDSAMAQRIVADVEQHLQGEIGIRRYLGDRYWTADYKDKVPPDRRTVDVSEDPGARDVPARPGEEAQWCIFDPVLAAIAGRRYLETRDAGDLERQTHYLNRALAQITGPGCPQGELRCPEAYYLERGRRVPNDHVPLLWTQANLRVALLAMVDSVASLV